MSHFLRGEAGLHAAAHKRNDLHDFRAAGQGRGVGGVHPDCPLTILAGQPFVTCSVASSRVALETLCISFHRYSHDLLAREC